MSYVPGECGTQGPDQPQRQPDSRMRGIGTIALLVTAAEIWPLANYPAALIAGIVAAASFEIVRRSSHE